MTTPFPHSGSADTRGASAPASSGFERLHSSIQRFLWEQGWGSLRPIQEAAIHALLTEPTRDVVLAAPTASGKTEAAFLPLLSRLVVTGETGDHGAGIDLLYVSPLKALINDQFGRLDRLCESLDIEVHRWHGDVPAARKQAVFRKPSGVLLITPESLEALFVRNGTHVARLLGNLHAVVVDELHAFFGSERGRQLQSLLHRIEAGTNRRIPRVALSATLSDLSLAAQFLRPGASPGDVLCLNPPSGGQEIQAQIRGYIRTTPRIAPASHSSLAIEALTEEDEASNADIAIASHLFSVLRGQHNLVFANSRREVESFADLLARLSEEARVPPEFVAHHGNLSRELRHDAEARLRDSSVPTTAICTSTLELGIDIGAMHTVAQIGAAPSVSALRQRLGRSGRRGEPCRLRVYVREEETTPNTPLVDRLRFETVQAIAQIRLLTRGWCEPPLTDGLHLSTLIQQVLSVIAERGGAGIAFLWRLLCKTGPFRDVDQATFSDFLRALHARHLITQTEDGTLLLGETGERIVNHYTFYAAFTTPEEWRVTAGGRALGTLPVEQPLPIGSFLVYAGQRWRVLSVDDIHRVLDLTPASGGRPPIFGGAAFTVEAEVRQEMKRVYEATEVPPFVNKTASALLDEGRAEFARANLDMRRIIPSGDSTLVFLWSSDRAATALHLELLGRGMDSENHGVCVGVTGVDENALRATLTHIAERGFAPAETLAARVPNAELAKYDEYLSAELRARQYAKACLDTGAALQAVRNALASDRPT